MELSPRDIEKLVNETYIESIELDVKVTAMAYESIRMLHILEVHSTGYNGSGIKVAVLDTGIVHNETFNIGAEYDFVEDDFIRRTRTVTGRMFQVLFLHPPPELKLCPFEFLTLQAAAMLRMLSRELNGLWKTMRML